ncbi:hypothetical protein Pmani_024572 [Petrolisthes manimaculis]|uniref:Uncharacterized protein n=1 Tax=Petrolisthes manimaculis TaxID=1843537 RepID=A0AAE1TYK0_9EUCA|nr:hypothetical protein Pmani_024572 [Petrolisthes manimaculis]
MHSSGEQKSRVSYEPPVKTFEGPRPRESILHMPWGRILPRTSSPRGENTGGGRQSPPDDKERGRKGDPGHRSCPRLTRGAQRLTLGGVGVAKNGGGE